MSAYTWNAMERIGTLNRTLQLVDFAQMERLERFPALRAYMRVWVRAQARARAYVRDAFHAFHAFHICFFKKLEKIEAFHEASSVRAQAFHARIQSWVSLLETHAEQWLSK